MVPLAARLPHAGVPKLIGVAMVRVDVVNNGCGLNPPHGLTSNADWRTGQVRLPGLCPAMIVTTLAGTTTPAVGMTLLLLPGQSADWSKQF